MALGAGCPSLFGAWQKLIDDEWNSTCIDPLTADVEYYISLSIM